MKDNSQKLTIFNFLGYGLLAIPLTLVTTTYYLYLPKMFESSTTIPLALIGFWLGVGRIFDAVTDPVCGYISDRLSLVGISRVRIIPLGGIILAISFYILGNINLFFEYPTAYHFGFFSLLMYLGSTLVTVPYEVLGVQITNDSSERSKLLAFRDGFIVFSTLLSALLPTLFMLINGKSNLENLSILCSLYSVLTLFFIFILVLSLKSNSNITIKSKDNKITLSNSLKLIIKNKNFSLLFISYVICSLGAAMPATLFFFYCEKILKISENQANLSLLIYFAFGLVSVPFWVKLIKHFNKKHLWICAQIINAGSFLPVYFLTNTDYYLFIILISISASGFGGIMVLPSIIQAEIVSKSEVENKSDLSGLFMGFWSVGKKLSQAIGSGFALYCVGLGGLEYLKLFYAVVPSILCILSIFIAKKIEA